GGRCPGGANTVKPTFPIMEALLWRRAVAGPVRPRGTPMTSRHGDPVGARLRQFYAALIDERRLGARRSFFARVFSFSESLPRSATGASCSLPRVSGKVGSFTRKRSLGVEGRNRSSCRP